MTDRPILFSAPMVRTLLDGSKTQTRRALKPQPEPWRDFHLEGGCQQADWKFETGKRTEDGETFDFGLWMHSTFHESRFQKIPYAVGDRLWVREAWRTGCAYDDLKPSDLGGEEYVFYEQDGTTVRRYKGDSELGRYRAGRFMPRWASRLTLIVTDVRVQRVRDISEEDAIAEGIYEVGEGVFDYHKHAEIRFKTAVGAYRDLWGSLNADRGYSWTSNPWIAAYTFTVHKGNIDMEKEG